MPSTGKSYLCLLHKKLHKYSVVIIDVTISGLTLASLSVSNFIITKGLTIITLESVSELKVLCNAVQRVFISQVLYVFLHTYIHHKAI